MSYYYESRNVAEGDSRTVDEFLYGGSSSMEALLDIASNPGPFTPYNQTGVELHRKPGESAGVLPGAHVVGNLLPANRVQVELPRWSPILTRFWEQLKAPVEFSAEFDGPAAGFPLVEKPPILQQAASAVGISPNALGWIVLGTLLLVLPVVLRK